jgi:hypothetical protein
MRDAGRIRSGTPVFSGFLFHPVTSFQEVMGGLVRNGPTPCRDIGPGERQPCTVGPMSGAGGVVVMTVGRAFAPRGGKSRRCCHLPGSGPRPGSAVRTCRTPAPARVASRWRRRGRRFSGVTAHQPALPANAVGNCNRYSGDRNACPRFRNGCPERRDGSAQFMMRQRQWRWHRGQCMTTCAGCDSRSGTSQRGAPPISCSPVSRPAPGAAPDRSRPGSPAPQRPAPRS